MNIGESVRVVTVEPIVSPVPDGDFPDRFAETPPTPSRPTPRSGAAEPEREPAPGS